MISPLHVQTWGQGPSQFLALHGWGGSHQTYLPLAPLIPDSAVVHAPDLPGYGESELPETWQVDHVAEMVADSVEMPDSVTVVGNCTGAVIGAELGKLYPQKISRMVLVDPFAYVPWYFSIFLKGGFGRRAYLATFASPIGRFFTNQALRGKRTEDSDLTASFEGVNHDATHEFLRMMGAHEGPERYRDLQMPIDILIGEKTFGAVKKSSKQLKTVWPHANVHSLENAGHLPIEEATEHVARLVFQQ